MPQNAYNACMMLRLQKYDLIVTYKKGSEMYLADTLSRAFVQSPAVEDQRQCREGYREYQLGPEPPSLLDDKEYNSHCN